MSISSFSLRTLKDFMPFKRVLALGSLDIISPMDELEKVFEDFDLSEPVFDKKAQEWHKISFTPVDSRWLMKRLGVETFDILDVEKWRGDEIVHDLNRPIEIEPYDLVIDHGTIEHCMNIGQALVNCANLAKVGGYVFHGPPMTMLNHGFYNVSPTLFHDFYVKQGWKMEYMVGVNKDGWFELPRTKRFQCPFESSVICLVKKMHGNQMGWQMQTKYSLKLEKAA